MRKDYLLLTLAVLIGFTPCPGMADQPVTPASLAPCPFTPEEIQAALGLTVDIGEAADMKFPGGRDVGCLYQIAGGSTTFAVRQTWDPAGRAGTAQAATEKGTRTTKPIPGDPDGAQWKVSSQNDDDPQVELSYTRGKVQTRVLVHGRSFRAPEIQSNLLKLRRVP